MDSTSVTVVRALDRGAIALGEHIGDCQVCQAGGPHCSEGARLLTEARRQVSAAARPPVAGEA